MIIEILRSTFLFFRKHMFVSCFLIVILSVLFLTGIYLHGFARSGMVSEATVFKYNQSRYVFAVEQGNQASLEASLADLIFLKENVGYFVISGNVMLTNEKGDLLNYPLHTYYPDASSDLVVESGTDELKMGESSVLLDQMGNNILIHGKYMYYLQEISEIHIVDKAPQQMQGLVTSAAGSWSDGLITDYSHFFDLTSSVDSILIQCKKPLSATDENKLMLIMNSHFSVNGVTLPFTYDKAVLDSYFITLAMYGTLVFACTFSAMKMVNYIAWLRKEEYRILRLVGATKFWNGISLISMLVILSSVSAVFGLVSYLLLDRVFNQIDLFQGLPVGQVALDLVVFIGITIVTGIIQMLLFSRQNRKSMTEEAV